MPQVDYQGFIDWLGQNQDRVSQAIMQAGQPRPSSTITDKIGPIGGIAAGLIGMIPGIDPGARRGLGHLAQSGLSMPGIANEAWQQKQNDVLGRQLAQYQNEANTRGQMFDVQRQQRADERQSEVDAWNKQKEQMGYWMDMQQMAEPQTAKPAFTPLQFYNTVRGVFDRAVQGGKNQIIGEANRGGLGAIGGSPATSIEGIEALAARQTPTSKYFSGEPDYSSLSKRYNQLGTPEHFQAFSSSPDSMWAHDPVAASLMGLPVPEQQQAQGQDWDAEGRRRYPDWDTLSPEDKATMIEYMKGGGQ